jgi:hypothetical protein
MLAYHRKDCCLQKYWNNAAEDVEEYDLANKKGRSRTEHENKLILCSLLMLLKTYLKVVNEKKLKISEVKWSNLYDKVAINLHVRRHHDVDLHLQLIEDGDVLVYGQGEDSKRGRKEGDYQRLNHQQIQSIVYQVDDYHANVQTITNREIRNYIKLEPNMTMGKMTISNYFKRLGLTWKKVNKSIRKVGEYRKDLLRTFIIEFIKVMMAINQDPVNCVIVSVCTDESYIHHIIIHRYSYMKEGGKPINRSNNKGERLIIMHAFTPLGVLAEIDNLSNLPVSEFQRKGDACHPHPREDGKLTCETIWKATSRKGDYHNNMNSEMFIKWVTEKFLPTLKQQHPGKKMLLTMDNAPYHHKREIVTLSSKTKKP